MSEQLGCKTHSNLRPRSENSKQATKTNTCNMYNTERSLVETAVEMARKKQIKNMRRRNTRQTPHREKTKTKKQIPIPLFLVVPPPTLKKLSHMTAQQRGAGRARRRRGIRSLKVSRVVKVVKVSPASLPFSSCHLSSFKETSRCPFGSSEAKTK